MYKLLIKGKLSKELRNLNMKNHVLFEAIFKKDDEICLILQHDKNLNYPLNKYKSVPIDSNFILCFSIDEKAQTVTLVKLAHHKDAY